MCPGEAGIVMFTEGENVWDYHRGRELEEETSVKPDEVEALDRLGKMLRESKWRPGSRQNYNAWFRTWLQYCKTNGCTALPGKQKWLFRFLTLLALHYAVGSVHMAVAAIVAIHRLNGFKNPFKDKLALEDLLKGVEACGLVGGRVQKCIVDAKFLAGLVEQFTGDFPQFDPILFDPTLEGRTVIWLRSTVLTVLGLELGVRPSTLSKLTLCCWQPRQDKTVGVQCDLTKNTKNGELFLPVLDHVKGKFCENGSAIAIMNEYWLPFLEEFGTEHNPAGCIKKKHRTAHCGNCPKLFPVFGAGKVNKAINPKEVSESVKRWAERLGRDKSKYSGKSLRRGSTSIAAAMKVRRSIRKQHGGWKADRMVDVYTELSSWQEKAVSKAIHKAMKKSQASRSKQLRFSV